MIKWGLLITVVLFVGCTETLTETESPLQTITTSQPPVVTQVAKKESEISLCPADCDDGDICTEDYCSEATDYQCKSDSITPCCGNDYCERGQGENCSTCNLDCWCPPPPNKMSCENKDYSVAFVLLVKNPNDATKNRIDKLSSIKDKFPSCFHEATEKRAQMDTSDDVHVVIAQSNMFDSTRGENSNWVISKEVTQEFYKERNDTYDFIVIFTAFDTELFQSHAMVFNNIKGTGQYLYDYSDDYGSKGKLRGVSFLRNIDYYDTPDTLYCRTNFNGLLHELGHQWCCHVGDPFARGQEGAELEIISVDYIHFYEGLYSPHGDTTPMGSGYWVPNDDGTFRREDIRVAYDDGTVGIKSDAGPKKYHPIQLYLMGLLPEEEYDTEFPVYDAGIGYEKDRQRAVFYKYVSVRDIIAIEGERICVEYVEQFN